MNPSVFTPYLYYLELARSEDTIGQNDEQKSLWEIFRNTFLRPFVVLLALFMVIAITTLVPQSNTEKSQLADTTDVLVGGTRTPSLQTYFSQDSLTSQTPFTTVNDSLGLGPLLAGADKYELVSYPASGGVTTGLFAPGFDQSVAVGIANTATTIKQARANDPTGTIVVAGTSQGAAVVTDTIKQLEAEHYDTSNMTFVLTGNVDRTSGGIIDRFPIGYIPGIGVTLGGATESQYSHVVQITNQYDIAGDSPAYVFNGLSWANVLLGFALGTHNYSNTSLDGATIVSVNSSGTITDILVPAAEGNLPILTLAKQAGMPENVAVALDPLLRALIETGYDRPVNGVYPDTPQRIRLLPTPDKWFGDAQSIASGAQVTGNRFAAMVPGATQLGSQIQNAVTPTYIQSNIQSTATRVQTTAQTAASNLQTVVQQQVATPIQSSLSSVQNSVQSALQRVPQPSVSSAQQTISAMQQTAQSAASQLQSQATAAVHQLFGIFGF